MDLFDTLQLELDDIKFDIGEMNKNLLEIRRMDKSREMLEKDVYEDEEYSKKIEEKMENKNLEEEKEDMEEYEDIEKERENEEREQKKVLMELFGDSDIESEDEMEEELGTNMKKNVETLKDLLEEDEFGVKTSELEKELNKGLESDEKFKLESKKEDEREKGDVLMEKELDRSEIIKIMDDESEQKIISPSFDEKLELVKEEIEKIDKKGKRKMKEVKCPEDKELNPKTGKCVKKCKEGETRDPETFKCKKQKMEKEKSSDKKDESVKLLDDYYEFSDGKFFNWIVLNNFLGFDESDREKLQSKEDIIMFDKSVTVKVPVDRYGEKKERSIKISKPVTVKNFIQTISEFYNSEKGPGKKMGDLVYYEGLQKGDDDKLYLILGS